jgi:hypothetical protein
MPKSRTLLLTSALLVCSILTVSEPVSASSTVPKIAVTKVGLDSKNKTYFDIKINCIKNQPIIHYLVPTNGSPGNGRAESIGSSSCKGSRFRDAFKSEVSESIKVRLPIDAIGGMFVVQYAFEPYNEAVSQVQLVDPYQWGTALLGLGDGTPASSPLLIAFQRCDGIWGYDVFRTWKASKDDRKAIKSALDSKVWVSALLFGGNTLYKSIQVQGKTTRELLANAGSQILGDFFASPDITLTDSMILGTAYGTRKLEQYKARNPGCPEKR